MQATLCLPADTTIARLPCLAAMPIFYTHVRQGNSFARDQEGIDFPSFALAHSAAVVAANQMIDADLAAGLNQVVFDIFIDDAAGTRLASLPVNVCVSRLH